MNFIAIDFETANSNRGSICSMGVAIVENGKLAASEHFLVKPTPNHYDSFNSYLHGIDDSKTKNKKTFREQWKELKKYFHKQVIVAHNASFDCSALRYSLDSSRLPYPNLDYHCTYQLSKATLPLSRFGLKEVSAHFKIKLNHHNAESDAIAAALIALRLCDQYNAGSLEELSLSLGFNIGRIDGKKKKYSPFSKNKSKDSLSDYYVAF